MNQQDQVLQYMKTHAYITSLLAIRELAILQLPTRIYKLKEAGIPVKCKSVYERNRYGKDVRIKRYYLEEQ